MLIQFIVGVNTFSFDPIIVTILLDDEKVLIFNPNSLGKASTYSGVLGFPTGFV